MDKQLSELKNGVVRYGRFYPQGYALAVFRQAEDRDRTVQEFLGLGWASEDLIEVEGSELLSVQQELDENRSLLEVVVSKFANRDRVYREALRLAQDPGYCFLLIYAPESEQRTLVRETLAGSAVLAEMFDSLSFSQIPVQN